VLRRAVARRAVLGALSLACASTVLSGCAAPALPHAAIPSAPPAASAALVSRLNVGECVNGSADTLLRDLTPVGCDGEHDYEVYAVVDIPATAYPGDDVVTAAAEAECAGAFEPFVGVPYPGSTLDYAVVTADGAAWEGGDFAAVCLVGDPAGPVTGSLATAAR
jgi:hypothetical protein